MDKRVGKTRPLAQLNITCIGNIWDGLIDEVRLFDKALSQSEVTFLFRNPAGVQMTATVPKDPGKENLYENKELLK